MLPNKGHNGWEKIAGILKRKKGRGKKRRKGGKDGKRGNV